MDSKNFIDCGHHVKEVLLVSTMAVKALEILFVDSLNCWPFS